MPFYAVPSLQCLICFCMWPYVCQYDVIATSIKCAVEVHFSVNVVEWLSCVYCVFVCDVIPAVIICPSDICSPSCGQVWNSPLWYTVIFACNQLVIYGRFRLCFHYRELVWWRCVRSAYLYRKLWACTSPDCMGNNGKSDNQWCPIPAKTTWGSSSSIIWINAACYWAFHIVFFKFTHLIFLCLCLGTVYGKERIPYIGVQLDLSGHLNEAFHAAYNSCLCCDVLKVTGCYVISDFIGGLLF